MKRYLYVVLAVISIAVLFLGACTPKTTAPTLPSTPTTTPAVEEPIKIGISMPMSGFWGFDVPYNITAAQMAVDAINAAGGVLGRQVEIIARDNQADPSLIVPEADALKAEGCVAIIGDFIDPDNYALSAWAEENHIPVFLQSSTASLSTTNFKKFSFQSAPNSWAEANIMVDQLAKKNVKSVLFFNADIGFSYEIMDFVSAGLEEKSPNTDNLGQVVVSTTETDYSSAISAILAKNPEVVINSVVSMNITAQMETFNFFEKTKVIGVYEVDVVFTTPYGKNFPEGAEGVTWYPFWLDDPAIQAFNKTFADKVTDKTILYPSVHSLQFYTTIIAIVEAIRAANSTDGDEMVNALETITFNTPVGALHYGAYDHVMRFPLYWVSTIISEDYPIVIGTILAKYGDEIYPTEAEVLAARQAE